MSAKRPNDKNSISNEKMELNLTQLKDLEHICFLAQTYYEKNYGLPEESIWSERIKIYLRMFQAEIAAWEKTYAATDGNGQRSDLEQLKADMETLVLEREKQINTLLVSLDAALKEIERLKHQ